MVHVFQYLNVPFGFHALERIGSFIISSDRSTKAVYIACDTKESEIDLSSELYGKIILSGRSSLIKSGEWTSERQKRFETLTDRIK